MKKYLLIITFHFSLFTFHSKADYWTQKASFPGSNRFGCFSFSIGTKGYVGCGYDSNWALTRNFWEYDQLLNTWSQKADYPDSARVYAIGFSINNKGYAGTGVSPAMGWMDDFYEYDPATNTWTPKADFGGGQRSDACSFVINGKAYVGTGTGVVPPYTFDDLWEYDPLTNVWTAKSPLPGLARIKAIGLATSNYGYIIMGSAGGNYFSDIWEYNPVTNSWVQKTNFPGDPKEGAAGLNSFNMLYLGTGNNHPATGPAFVSKDWWKYNPFSNQWTTKTSFSGFPRCETGYFAINNKGYVGIGVNANIQYNDFWEYTGDGPSSINEMETLNYEFRVSPNPANEYIIISSESAEKENLEITITDVHGKIVYENEPITFKKQYAISLKSLTQGIYFVVLNDGKVKTAEKFLKE